LGQGTGLIHVAESASRDQAIDTLQRQRDAFSGEEFQNVASSPARREGDCRPPRALAPVSRIALDRRVRMVLQQHRDDL
jgi:hypothetical protein